jgi:PAT family beta-lactamase induction signal transducer AmpG
MNDHTLSRILDRRVLVMCLLGFSAGLPILLIFSTLSLWLSEAGVSRSAVTFFSWAALGYSFKFVWAPLVDKLPLPLLSGWLGRRRGWMLLAQLAIALAIILMATTNPAHNLTAMAVAAVLLGFSSATQDIVIDAYRIEIADVDLQALLSSSYVAGYRIGMIAAGAGSLYLADLLGSTSDAYSYIAWRDTYLIMAALMGVGVFTTLCIAEPRAREDDVYPYQPAEYLRLTLLFLLAIVVFVLFFRAWPSLTTGIEADGPVAGFLVETGRLFSSLLAAAGVAWLLARLGLVGRKLLVESFVDPVVDFFRRYGRHALFILLLVGVYRISDIVMGVIANLFYQDMGFTKTQIASVTKVFGLLMTIAGSFFGGFLAVAVGVGRVLILGAVLSALTNLLFMIVAGSEPDMFMLTCVIAADNFSAGIAVAAFIAWLSSLTSISFTAVQYAIFSSVMTLFPKLLGGYSGSVVDAVGYPQFFLYTTLLGVPVVLLAIFIQRMNK